MNALDSIRIRSLAGEPLSLTDLGGQVLLIVNVASRCGYTPQYAGLEALYRKYRMQGFTLIGVPCNQFGGQEPGTASEIETFCRTHYEVSFPLTEKIEVNGPGRHPLYRWLTDPAQGHPGDIRWNFEKFLIGREGRVVARFASDVSPDAFAPELARWIAQPDRGAE
ncbi:MAG: glutathione peroxidase [Gammaproteobacteria bacterium]